MKNFFSNSMTLLKVFFAVVLIFSATSAMTQTITSTGSGGDWNQTTTWVGGTVPGVGNDVVIASGATVTVTDNRSCASLTLGNNSATVSVNSGFTLAVTNAITLPHISQQNVVASLTGSGAITAGSLSVGNAITSGGGNNTVFTTTLTTSVSSLTISGNLTLQSTNNGNRRLNATLNVSTGTVTVGGQVITINGTPSTANISTLTLATGSQNATLNLSGASPIFNISADGTSTITLNGTSSTVNYSGAAQTVRATAYTNLTLSGSGTKTLQTGTTVSGNLTVSGTATATTVEAMTGIQNLTVGSGSTLNIAGFNTTINGTTSVTGSLNHTSATGTKIHIGLVTINNGGVWNNSGLSAIDFRNGITNNGTFTAGTGTQNFTTNSQALNGTFSIPTVAVPTGITLTNNGTLTVTTGLNGLGGFTNSATGTLNINFTGTAGITTLTATAAGNTVNYGAAGAQTVRAVTYHHLTLSNSGAKTMTSVSTVNGNLSMSGSATTTGVSGLTVSGNLSLSGTSQFTTAGTVNVTGNLVIGDGTVFRNAGHASTITGTTTVGGGTSGQLLIENSAGTKIFTGLVTVAANGTWNNSGNSVVEFRNGITNNGTFTAGSGAQTFNTNAQALNGTLSIPSVTVTGVTLTNNGSLTVTTALAGSGGLTNAATGTLNINFTGAVGITTLTTTAAGNTVNYGAAGAQTVRAVTYHHLTLSNSGAKTMTDVTTITGDLTVSGTATMANNGEFTVGGTFFYESSSTTNLNSDIEVNKFNQTDGEISHVVDEKIIVAGTGEDVYIMTGGVCLCTIQFTGENPQISGEVRTVEVSVGNTLTLSGNLTITEELNLNAGSLSIDENTLTLEGTVNFSGGRMTGSTNSNLVITETAVVSGGLVFDNSSEETRSLNNLVVETNVSLGSRLNIMNELLIDGSNLSIGSNQLRLYGDLNVPNGGNLIGTSSSRIWVDGPTADPITLPGMTLNILDVYRPNGIVLSGPVTLNTRLVLGEGEITGASNLVLGNRGRITVLNGSMDSYPSITNPDIAYSGDIEITTGNEIPPFTEAVFRIFVNNPAGVILGSDLNMDGSLNLDGGNLNINGRTINLGTKNAILRENNGYSVVGTSGQIITNRVINNVVDFDYHNIGLRLTIPAAFRETEIIRGFTPFTINDDPGIFRYYEINPTSNWNNKNLNATLVFSYDPDDLNGNIENTLELYSRKTATSPWILMSNQVLNTVTKTITVTGVDTIPQFITAKGIQEEGDNPMISGNGEQLTNTELIPEEYSLSQNYPNPFNPTTTIKYQMPENGNVSLKVFDMTGREVMNLVNGFKNAGFHTAQFDGNNLASGVYFYRLDIRGETQEFSRIMRMMLIK